MNRRLLLGVVLLVAALVVGVVAAADRSGDDSNDDAGSTSTTRGDAASTSSAPPTTSRADALAAGLCPELPPDNEPDPERPRYTGTVDIDPASGSVRGSLTVVFTPDLPTGELVFRLWPNSPRPVAAGASMVVSRATTAGAAMPATLPDATTLVLTAPHPLAAGESIMVTLDWQLSVPQSVSDRISRSGDTLRLGTFLPLLAWEPGTGWAREPATAGFAEAATSMVADYDLTLRAPEGYDVLATGERRDGNRWEAKAVRDFAASVGHFALASTVEHLPHEVQVTVGVDRSIDEDPQAYLTKVVESLRSFSTRFGTYGWTTFSLAITPELGGGIEFPTHVMQGPETVGRTTSHEVGHMWFYSLVGNNQGRDPWLDEGLASYAEFTFEGDSDAAGLSIPRDAAGHGGEPMTFWDQRLSSYYRGVYVQPAVALASLGSTDQVDCSLRHYVAAMRHRIARPADLFAALSVVFADAVTPMARAGLSP